MNTPSNRPGQGPDRPLKKSRARTLILLTIVLIIVVAFGYMILVGSLG